MAYKKYFTFSFDDGLEQDKKIIRILKEYGMYGCTFNLNAGLLGSKKAMGRISEYGFAEKDDLTVLNKKHHLVHYVEEFRIPADEIAQVYEGFEIAGHAYRHENLKKLSGKELETCIRKDTEELRRITGQSIRGYAYPFGACSDEAISVLKNNGILYARTTMPGKGFGLPDNPYKLAPTCWMGQKETFDLVEKFLNTVPTEQDQMFCVWGHGYEFDFGTERNNWDNLKRLCQMVSDREDITSCTITEFLMEREERRESETECHSPSFTTRTP